MNPASILELAGLHRPPVQSKSIEEFEWRLPIIRGLIEIRQAGILEAIYCDNFKLSVVLPGGVDLTAPIRQHISWIEASRMVEEFHKQTDAPPCPVERRPLTRRALVGEAKINRCQISQ